VITALRLVLGLLSVILAPLLAAVLLVAAFAAIGAPAWPVPVWLALAPVIYIAWVLVFLAVSAVEFQVYGLIAPKPRRLTIEDARLSIPAAVLLHTYQRLGQVHTLPLANGLLRLPILQRLVLLSYAPRIHVGRDVLIYGLLYDPELIYLGDRVIIGGGSALAAHGLVNQSHGRSSYVSAPIRLGRDATVGGESRVGLGVTMGEGAVVEPGSVVDPFTTIPAGQVWGGSPARFRRFTDPGRLPVAVGEERPTPAIAHVPTAVAVRTAVPLPTGVHREAAQRLVDEALRISQGPTSASAGDIAWDSLDQLVIATLAQERHGVVLNPDAVYRLRSVLDVERLIAGVAIPDDGAEPAASPRTQLPTDPELLPLLDRAEATRGLAERSTATSPAIHGRVVIASTFTAQPLTPSLKLWAGAFGIDLEIEVADFNHVEAALLSPSGAFQAAPVDAIRVVLVRAEELAVDPSARLARARGLLAAIEQFATDHGSLVVGSLPPPLSPVSPGARAALDELRAEWQQRLEALPRVEILDVTGVVERLGTVAAANPGSEVTSRLPWSAEACRDLGIEIARSVRRRFVPPAKVIAIDCDGTLWRGVVAEDGVEGLGVSSDGRDRAFQLLQERLRELKDRGLLLALVSRNEEADVWRAFEQHPAMVLRRDDIAAWRISWRPKSQLIAELATEMGLAPDAFVFLDDDPAVRMEVAANAPAVHVVPLPDQPVDRLATLAALWCFDGAEPTEVDRARTQMLQVERERQRIQADAVDIASYLGDLGLVVSIHAATDAELPRVAQLTQRTNQFNTSLRRRSLDEIAALRREATVLSLSASDRFGDYGLVGLAILHPDGPGCVRLDTMLMSCRALGRGIEQTLLHVTAEEARATGADRLRADWTEGPRNDPALDFLRQSGFVEEAGGTMVVSLDRGFDVPPHVTLDAQATPQPELLRATS